MANREREMQDLNLQLAQKDLQLESLRGRLSAAEEEQKDAMNSLRHMLQDKDKTIQVLFSVFLRGGIVKN